MTPEEKREFEQMKTTVRNLQHVEDVSFIESLIRRLNIPARLSDLDDVTGTDGATTGQVLKKTATTWQPGTDNTA